jgi:hypothetical protein
LSLGSTLKTPDDGEGGVVIRLDSGRVFAVNYTALAFLVELNGSRAISEISARLSGKCDAEESSINATLIEIADAMIGKSLLRVRP